MRIFFFLAKLLLHFKCKDHIINKKQITYDQNDKFGNYDKVQSWVQSSPLLPSDLKSCDFCSQSFESLDDLANHMVEDHQDADEPEKSNNEKQNDISDPDHPNVQEINNVETTPGNADSEVDIDSDK